jgi:hypothetical protein
LLLSRLKDIEAGTPPAVELKGWTPARKPEEKRNNQKENWERLKSASRKGCLCGILYN